MLRLVVGPDARRQRIDIFARAHKRVRQGEGDQAGEGQDEEGEELGLEASSVSALPLAEGDGNVDTGAGGLLTWSSYE